MKICPNSECSYFQRHGEPAEYRDEISTCADCGNALVEPDASPAEESRPRGSRAELWRRLAVTVSIPLLADLASWITLPGVDRLGFQSMLNLSEEGHSGLAGIFDQATSYSWTFAGIMAIGLLPLLTAYMIVECFAVLVPAWNHLRTGGPAGRARLTRAVGWVVLFTAAIQALPIAIYLENLHGWTLQWPIVPQPGWGFRGMVVLTLTATTMLLWFGTRVIDRHGLGNGFSVFIAWSVLWVLYDFGTNAVELARTGGLAPIDLPLVLGATVFVCWLAWWGHSTRRHALPQEENRPTHLPLPSAGITPYDWAASILLLPATLEVLFPGQGWITWLTDLAAGETSYFLLLFGLTVPLVVSFGWIFNLPTRMASVWQALLDTEEDLVPHARRRMWRGIAGSALFFAALMGVDALTYHYSALHFGLNPVLFMITALVVRDLSREWSFRWRHGEVVRVWPLHRVYAVRPALDLLERNGIPAHPRGFGHRVLLNFFGPFVPVDLFVRVKDADRARELLASRLLPSEP